ncbi:MAG: hypothetical protein AAFY31_00510 [Pseudomonadota bacterium]
MTTDDVDNFLNALQVSFLGADWDTFLTFFKLPLVVYTAAGVSVLRSQSELLTAANSYHEAMGALDITSAQVNIENREPLSNDRFRATVRVRDFTGDGEEVTGSLVRYFLVRAGPSYQVEMLEYLETAIPISEMQRILH